MSALELCIDAVRKDGRLYSKETADEAEDEYQSFIMSISERDKQIAQLRAELDEARETMKTVGLRELVIAIANYFEKYPDATMSALDELHDKLISWGYTLLAERVSAELAALRAELDEATELLTAALPFVNDMIGIASAARVVKPAIEDFIAKHHAGDE